MNVIIKSNLRHQFAGPFLSAVGILLITGAIFPVTALKGTDTARPLEFLLPFIGAALLGSVFLPEQDKGIRDVVEAKKINCSVVYLIRLLYSILVLVALVSLFVGFLKLNECEVRWLHLYGGIASAFFMGSIAFMASGISGNTVIGYMTTVIYYLACYAAKKYLGVFWLFRMSAGINTGKIWLILGGGAMIAATFGVLAGRRRK